MNWANVDRVYERDIVHFVPLCARCHRYMDSQKMTLPQLINREAARKKLLLVL
jgi:hypothetical protein